MSEPLENEIEEELRKKQLKALWDRFGLYLIGVILIIIMSFGGYEFSKYLGYKNSESQRSMVIMLQEEVWYIGIIINL